MTARIALLVLSLLLVAGCGRPRETDPNLAARPALYQYSTLAALSAGDLEGQRTVAELAAKGDLGLGTYNGLDGEMIVLDGVFYRADQGLRLTRPDPDQKVPFLNLVHFAPTGRADAPATDLAGLSAWLDARVGSARLFAAAKVSGSFRGLTVRSVPGFAPPYPTLAEAIKRQATKSFDEVQGTLVAIRCPAEASGPAVPGWHFHFVSRDKTQGGHVLQLAGASGLAEWMGMEDLILEMPGGASSVRAQAVAGETAASPH